MQTPGAMTSSDISSSLSRYLETIWKQTTTPDKSAMPPNEEATVKDVLKQLKKKLEAGERRFELRLPTSLENFKTNLRWMYHNGEEEDLVLLCRIKKNPPYDLDDIERLMEMVDRRIRERVNKLDRVIEKGEEAYQLRYNEWEEQFSGQFIAIYGGEVVGHADTKPELYPQISEAQKQVGPFRAYIVKVGAPTLIARGPRMRLGGQAYSTKSRND
jgi:hypothetical protein